MVTVKRKINNESDKYGGFSEIDLKTPSDREIGSSYSDAQYKEAEARINYSKPETKTNFDREVKDFDSYTSAPQPVQREIEDVNELSADEIMPKIVTHERDFTAPRQKKAEKLDSRTKLILGVYISVILILSALVIGTGIAISSTDARIGALESEVSAKNAVIAEQMTEIANLSNEDSITGRAYNNGMERTETYEDIELLPIGDAPKYEGVTNWFDSFCDWLNGVFGG